MNYPFSLALWGFDNRKINELKADLHLSGFKTETYYSDSRWVAISIEGLQDGYCWPWECER